MHTPPSSPATPAPSGLTVSRISPSVAIAAAAVLLAGTLAGRAGALLQEGTTLGWLCDLTTHFRVYGLGIALAATVLTLCGGPPAARVAFGATVLVTLADLLPSWLPDRAPARAGAHAAPDDDARALFVVCLNVQWDNPDTGRTLAYLRATGADLVVLLEVDPNWADALAGLATDYPFAHVEPRESFEGLALFSRWPLHDTAIVDFGTRGAPSIVTSVESPAGNLAVIATHPRPPLTPAFDRELRAHLRAVGRRAAATPGPCLVVGDLNATPWSAAFHGLMREGRLVDSARGRGIQPTWNARLWAPRIPIDHVLVTPDVTVIDRRLGPDVGSDHLPVEARVRLPPPHRAGASSARSMPSLLSFL
jgi:endonuclease/exonuclease/phosphatase (EEP) superfamily protein YafD